MEHILHDLSGTDNWQQIHIYIYIYIYIYMHIYNKLVRLFTHQTMCVYKEWEYTIYIISYVMFNRFKHVSLYKSVGANTSASRYEIANGVNQTKI